jgi:hypothetical protein
MRRAVTAAPAELGAASVLLLAASIRWAHHWQTTQTQVLVVAWAVATGAALVVGLRRRARLGLALVAVSLIALVVAGAVWAAGYDPAGACGGG